MLKKFMLIAAIVIGVLSALCFMSKFSNATIWAEVPWPVVIIGMLAAAALYYFGKRMSD